MGECINPNCKKPIIMTQTEVDWWKKKTEEEGAHMPKRCKACRQERKVKRVRESACSTALRQLLADYDIGKIEVQDAITKLEQMVVDIEGLEKLASTGVNNDNSTEQDSL
jgi:recombinational DNA repair protein RecT